MSEDELLAIVIDQLVEQLSQLALFTTVISTRLSSLEEDVASSSSTPVLFDATKK